jgi:hypothetical protein
VLLLVLLVPVLRGGVVAAGLGGALGLTGLAAALLAHGAVTADLGEGIRVHLEGLRCHTDSVVRVRWDGKVLLTNDVITLPKLRQ